MHGVAAFGTCGCRMAAETAAFVKSLRNFLRGPSDDATLRDELYELAEARLISREQAARSRSRSRCVHWPSSTRPHLHATRSVSRHNLRIHSIPHAGRCHHGSEQPSDVLPQRHVRHTAQGACGCYCVSSAEYRPAPMCTYACSAHGVHMHTSGRRGPSVLGAHRRINLGAR